MQLVVSGSQTSAVTEGQKVKLILWMGLQSREAKSALQVVMAKEGDASPWAVAPAAPGSSHGGAAHAGLECRKPSYWTGTRNIPLTLTWNKILLRNYSLKRNHFPFYGTLDLWSVQWTHTNCPRGGRCYSCMHSSIYCLQGTVQHKRIYQGKQIHKKKNLESTPLVPCYKGGENVKGTEKQFILLS